VLKDHWRHPRPRDLIEFGGAEHYVPAPVIGGEEGASFPCGHCTVGFLYGVGWWVWRRKRPQLAAASLVLGSLLGALLGVGRLAAGAHFLSDIVWSALLAFAVTHLLYYRVLRLDRLGRGNLQTAGSQREHRWGQAAIIATALGGAGVLIALFITPHGTQLTSRVALSAGSPRIFEIEAERANLTLVLTDKPAAELAIEGELHGFGLPTSRLGARLETVPGPQPALRYRIEAHGWLTDVDSFATVRIPAAAFERVSVRVQRGDIRVIDTTRAGVVRARRVQLELHAAQGRIQLP
jgi:lipid A 4'-phosphatase